MGHAVKSRSHRPGTLPGSLIHTGEKQSDKVVITKFCFDADTCEEKTLQRIEEAFPLAPPEANKVTWIHIQGVHQAAIIEALMNQFNWHRLVAEDVMSCNQRPKVEEYDNYLFIVARSLIYNEKSDRHIEDEQISLIVGDRYLISFQETITPLFDAAKDRLRNGRGLVRKMGSDYLAYTLIDILVDNYYVMLEKLGLVLEDIEEHFASDTKVPIIDKIHRLRREMIFVRKAVWPMREVISRLQRQESPLFSKTTLYYLRDVYDHTIQVIDTIEMYRDLISGILDVYLSTISRRLSEVMKVLTIVATLFAPLTFITGIFGMNFVNIPALHTPWGFYAALCIMGVVAICMLSYFHHKKWI